MRVSAASSGILQDLDRLLELLSLTGSVAGKTQAPLHLLIGECYCGTLKHALLYPPSWFRVYSCFASPALQFCLRLISQPRLPRLQNLCSFALSTEPSNRLLSRQAYHYSQFPSQIPLAFESVKNLFTIVCRS